MVNKGNGGKSSGLEEQGRHVTDDSHWGGWEKHRLKKKMPSIQSCTHLLNVYIPEPYNCVSADGV